MTAAVRALCVPERGAPLTMTTIERSNVGVDDVLIDVSYVGVCHSDVHLANDDWGYSRFPLIPGHEVTGIVRAAGVGVTRHAVGDRVAVGNLRGACRTCASCRAGLEQYCRAGGAGSEANGHGGFSEQIVVNADFVLSLPDAVDMAAGAPLLCAGITMYSALRHWEAGPGTRVAIAGMGGLGHLGVQLAAGMGAEVAVLSRSAGRRADALRFGAHGFFVLDDEPDLSGRFDLIISTAGAGSTSATATLLAMLDTDGTLVMAGAPVEPLSAPVGLLIPGRRSLAGSSIGGIGETQEMLDFCAAHDIAAQVQVVRADEIDDAFARLDRGDASYRYVLDASTL